MSDVTVASPEAPAVADAEGQAYEDAKRQTDAAVDLLGTWLNDARKTLGEDSKLDPMARRSLGVFILDAARFLEAREKALFDRARAAASARDSATRMRRMLQQARS